MTHAVHRRQTHAAERELERQLCALKQNWHDLQHQTQRSMTPARIICTGLGAGAIAALAAPISRLGGGARVVQLATTLFTLIGASQAQEAAETAEAAAETTAEAAVEVAAESASA
jgi:hypothetical protein